MAPYGSIHCVQTHLCAHTNTYVCSLGSVPGGAQGCHVFQVTSSGTLAGLPSQLLTPASLTGTHSHLAEGPSGQATRPLPCLGHVTSSRLSAPAAPHCHLHDYTPHSCHNHPPTQVLPAPVQPASPAWACNTSAILWPVAATALFRPTAAQSTPHIAPSPLSAPRPPHRRTSGQPHCSCFSVGHEGDAHSCIHPSHAPGATGYIAPQ